MTDAPGGGPEAWADARLALRLLAVDAAGLGGLRLRARAGPVRDRWFDALRDLCPDTPMPRLPLHADADRLTGGLDLAATLRAGRPIAEEGLLKRADGGLLLVAMAERIDPELAATIGLAMETGRVHGPLTGGRSPVDADAKANANANTDRGRLRFGVVALDEGVEADERVPAGLEERLALQVDLAAVTVRDVEGVIEDEDDRGEIARARARWADVRVEDDVIEAVCALALAFGIGSLRAPWQAIHAARILAALDGRDAIDQDDIAAAVRLVLLPRATTLPAGADDQDDQDEPEVEEGESPDPDDPPESQDDEPPPDPDPESEDGEPDAIEIGELIDRVLDAVRARLPKDLLDDSRRARAAGAQQGGAGKSGAQQRTGLRGRPAGVRRGRPGPNARLNLVETLRAAAPWQPLRRAEGTGSNGPSAAPRVQVRLDDFRVTRFKQRRETTTVFVVDASGSSALHRLAEAKGAIELLLADCYVRRDSVALVTFRGTGAEVLLPPTRSLVQAKRRLAELPGGGGTPVAAGLDCALALADSVQRRGATPVLVVLTDGSANIARDGTPGREQAREDALDAAARLRASGRVTLLVDTSPRPRPLAAELARAMGARYIPLPHADAAHLSAAVRAETA